MSDLQPVDIIKAANRLSGIVNQTPVLKSRNLNKELGAEIYFKCENFQRIGAFKFRGAYNAISQLSMEQKNAGVITHSSGNHAQGVALAANLLGLKATVVMPWDAPIIKRDATVGYGAKIIPCEAIERELVTNQLVEEFGYTLIHPYDNDQIIAGQGTAALELFSEIGDLELLFVPVGGGGLISGSALAAAALSPDCEVTGVEPETADDANRSWREGRIISLDIVPNTVADGLRPRSIGKRNLRIMRRYVANMITINEEAIMESLRYIWQRMKIVVEPSAAVALAPVLSGQIDVHGKRVGILLSGGNVELSKVSNFYGSQGANSIHNV